MKPDVKHPVRPPKTQVAQATPTARANRNPTAKRRSNRLLLSSSIELSGVDRLKCPFSMPAKATNLNKNGAALLVSRDLEIGSIIVLRHKRGTEARARVVSQLSATQTASLYGIEFVEPDEKSGKFWGITFPVNAVPTAMTFIRQR